MFTAGELHVVAIMPFLLLPNPSPDDVLPDPTALLFGLALAVFCAVWFLDRGPTQVVAIGIILAPVVFVLTYALGTRPFLATVLLVAASACPRLFLTVGGVKARPEHVSAGLLVLALPWLWDARENTVHWIFADRLVVAYMAMNLLSSWFMSPEPGQTLKWAVQQLLAIVPYFVLRVVVSSDASFRRMFRLFLIVGALEGAYAVLAAFATQLFGTTFGLDWEQYGGDFPAVYALQFEPNILGAFCGACAVMLLTMYWKERQRWYLLGYTVALAGMAVSFSRAALLATAFVLGVLLCWALCSRSTDGRFLRHAALATVLVGVLLSPVVVPGYIERFSTLDVSNVAADPNTMTREVQSVIGIDQITKHPIMGNGTASFQLMFDWEVLGTDWENQGWLGNAEVRILHDTGLLGFAFFAGAYISLMLAAWRLHRREMHPELVALVLSAMVYVLTFQTTEGTLLSFPWVHLGAIACAIAVYNGRQPGDDARLLHDAD